MWAALCSRNYSTIKINMVQTGLRTLFAMLLLVAALPVQGQNFDNPVEEFDAIFTPLQQVEGSVCARYHNWNQDKVQPLFRDQLMLFRQAYAAVSAADDDWLRSLVTDSNTYLDMYAFMSNIRQLAQSNVGVKYMYQERYDESQEQHRRLGANLSAAPDVIVGIFWCQPMGEDTAPRYTGGYAYLRVVDGEWKFHTR